MKALKAVVFDLDGTILDTSIGVLSSLEYTVAKLGFKAIPNEIKSKFIGPPVKSSLKSYFNLSEDTANMATEIFRNRYKEIDLLKAEIYPSMIELLEFLKANNIPIGVATYKREDYALLILEHFGVSQYCTCIKGADFENKLSKSDILKLCLDEMNVEDYTKTVLIGDSEYDAIGASEIGINFIGVTYGFGFKSKEECDKYKALFFANTVTEVIDFLRG